ncbi:MAG: hypothetical protein ACLUAJ_07180 [Ruminococcus bicirculans (ex Wegman et al. 2014)]|uniref:hypothetical protein n=1 Tax=Ruminococcus bicirculans (ex Wegman et al. 2014) TaxID=1160721 RepID=UPI00399186E0
MVEKFYFGLFYFFCPPLFLDRTFVVGALPPVGFDFAFGFILPPLGLLAPVPRQG